MTGQLIMLPVRLWWRGARLLVHTAEDATELALTATLRVAGAIENLRGGGASSPADGNGADVTAPATPAAAAPATPAPAATDPAAASPAQPLAGERLAREGFPAAVDLHAPTAEDEPAHVSEEPELAATRAEPGAEDGAGAEVRIQPPWEGYERMSAREVIARCSGASSAELAAVELYERSRRSRRTVLQAVERELRSP